jgi:pyruvate-ferredoxin/flavodoxin oxidoreductase
VRAGLKAFPGQVYSLQVAPEDCTGCTLCVEVCPAKDKSDTSRKAINMVPQPPIRAREIANWDFFLHRIPDPDRRQITLTAVKDSQVLRPLFEFSGACAGCRETPYMKLPAVATVRRPRHHRQRHRLLVDLRRQPAHHPLDGQP